MSRIEPGSATLLGCAAAGILVLAVLSDLTVTRDFARGLFAPRAAGQAEMLKISELRAELAQPALLRELEANELDELLQGMTYHQHGQNEAAVPILGKFALLGDRRAQSTIGRMYYLGMGLPSDRNEAIRWFELAARQGGTPERRVLAAALYETSEIEGAGAEQEAAYAAPPSQSPYYPESFTTRSSSAADANLGAVQGYGEGRAQIGDTLTGARSSVDEDYGSRATISRRPPALITAPAPESISPVILNQAGPGNYSNSNGDIFVQAGRHGVVNTRTGEFAPTN